ncbi:hypothetical protein FHX42_000325 [Saccharopolyspora lacisalsi]|uniref:Uncharacterized protein n=1 Tax=Halosaccharopolyspora lacisalsi TaxID=1000566 RepID=A0A839DRU4_9PSEU|nr:hypothetical protein [Halosaccharopolyspora lacisalsi]MBA8822996.1 hypothetical protein [Halosaccharopolyspora lacisalsi]
MFPSPFRAGSADVFWIVGVGTHVRHATTVLPGARPGGYWVPTVCEQWIRWPFDTVSDRTPESKRITERCPTCTETAEDRDWSGSDWDF